MKTFAFDAILSSPTFVFNLITMSLLRSNLFSICAEKCARKAVDRKDLPAFERGRERVLWTPVC
jgi:hypothetical protein